MDEARVPIARSTDAQSGADSMRTKDSSIDCFSRLRSQPQDVAIHHQLRKEAERQRQRHGAL